MQCGPTSCPPVSLPEIQELRHKSQSSGDANNATSVIDQSLVSLDERIEVVSTGIKAINDALEPLLGRAERTPTFVNSDTEEEQAMMRKHAALVAEWEAVQKDVQVLREELKEDKWLTVFRTVTDQADGMMSSLEKAVNRCQVRVFVFRASPSPLTCTTHFTRSSCGKCRNEGSTNRSLRRMFRHRGVLISRLSRTRRLPRS